MNTFRIAAALMLAVGGIAALPAQAQQAGLAPTQPQLHAPATGRGPAGVPADFAQRNMAANAHAFDVGSNGRASRSDAFPDAIAGMPPRPELRFVDQQPLGRTMFDDPAIW